MGLNEQEKFWKGAFGNEYSTRNAGSELLASNIAFFSRLLSITGRLESVVEFGCNVGMNLKAINALVPNCQLTGVEINETAINQLREWNREVEIIEGSFLGLCLAKEYELAFTKGVLIHIAPEFVKSAYQVIYRAARRYIAIAEYYSPVPVELTYRGYNNKLFKRDFAGELMEIYSDLELVDYGFLYHRDPVFPQDDINWFLLKKNDVE